MTLGIGALIAGAVAPAKAWFKVPTPSPSPKVSATPKASPTPEQVVNTERVNSPTASHGEGIGGGR